MENEQLQKSSRLIPLNLIFDYPVKWSKFKVLRDIIQNFYDAVGYRNWQKKFSYEIDGSDRLILRASDVVFSYDWLVHIGASTKRDNEGEYAGYFGEGFKIASLCALRDHHWNIEMISRDWQLKVVTDKITIDNKKMNSLAYRVRKLRDIRQETCLVLYPFEEFDKEKLESALLSFFYPKNPLFGKKIWCSSKIAVYHRSKYVKPPGLPTTYNYSGEGIIYASYQALGSFPHPIIFCLHNHRNNDRERHSFYRMDVIKVIEQISWKLPPEAAATILELLKSRWYNYPQKNYDFDSWYSIIKNLARTVSESPEQTRQWREKYPDLLVARKVKQKDIPAYNRRRQAFSWLHGQEKKYRLVQDGFSHLEYSTLEEICEKNDGFSITREPRGLELRLIGVLEEAVKILLKNYLGKISLPPCKVLKDGQGVWSGMANLIPLSTPRKTPGGLKIRFNLPYVALKGYLLSPGFFGSALSTYIHELAHCFGGDRSANFSLAISEILDITLSNTPDIETFRKKWEKQCCEFEGIVAGGEK